MAIEIDYDAGTNQLALCGKLTIFHAAQVVIPLREHAGATLDLSAVVELDGAGLQLLIAGRRDAGIRIGAVSEAVAEVIRLTGRGELLEEAS